MVTRSAGDLTGKNALVTGSSRGIGRAIAQRLAARGANVVVSYVRNRDQAEQVVATILANGGRAVSERMLARARKLAAEEGVSDV